MLPARTSLESASESSLLPNRSIQLGFDGAGAQTSEDSASESDRSSWPVGKGTVSGSGGHAVAATGSMDTEDPSEEEEGEAASIQTSNRDDASSSSSVRRRSPATSITTLHRSAVSREGSNLLQLPLADTSRLASPSFRSESPIGELYEPRQRHPADRSTSPLPIDDEEEPALVVPSSLVGAIDDWPAHIASPLPTFDESQAAHGNASPVLPRSVPFASLVTAGGSTESIRAPSSEGLQANGTFVSVADGPLARLAVEVSNRAGLLRQQILIKFM